MFGVALRPAPTRLFLKSPEWRFGKDNCDTRGVLGPDFVKKEDQKNPHFDTTPLTVQPIELRRTYIPYNPWSPEETSQKQLTSEGGLTCYAPKPTLPPTDMHYFTDGTYVPKFRWDARHWLFRRFDEGIQLDGTGFLDVTPEDIAQHIAKRMRDYTHVYDKKIGLWKISENIKSGIIYPEAILEGCAGYGGNSIQLAKLFPDSTIIAVERDAFRISKCRHNARIYGSDNVKFLKKDFIDFCEEILAQNILEENHPLQGLSQGGEWAFPWVFVSPPWGGENYKCQETFSLKSVPILISLLEAASKVAMNLALYLPATASIGELVDFAHSHLPDCGLICIERITVSLTGVAKYTIAYFLHDLVAVKKHKQLGEAAGRLLSEGKHMVQHFEYLVMSLKPSKFMKLLGESLTKPLGGRTRGGVFFALLKEEFPSVAKALNRKRKAEAKAASQNS